MSRLITRIPLGHTPRKRIRLCLSWRPILNGEEFTTRWRRSEKNLILLFLRLRVVSNFGDGDWTKYTRARIYFRHSLRVASPRNFARVRVCISPAPQSPSPKLETTRSLIISVFVLFCFSLCLFVCLFVRSFLNFVELDMKYCRYLGCLLEIFEITLTPYKIPRLKQGYQAR